MNLKVFFLTIIVILVFASFGIGALYYRESGKSEWQETLEQVTVKRDEYFPPYNELISSREALRRSLSEYAEYARRISDGEELIDLGDEFSQLGNDIFWYGNKVVGVDAKTFEVLGYGYAKDVDRAYFEGTVIPTADPATFKTIATKDPYISYQWHLHYAKDVNQAYFESRPILGADVATFEYLGAGYAHDKKFAYFSGGVINGADSPSFLSIGYGFARDKNKVYRADYALDVAIDPASAYMSEGYTLKDRNHVYINDIYGGYIEVLNADPATFAYIGACCTGKYCGGYYADKNFVYHDNERLDQAQRSSFQYFGVYESGNFEVPYTEAFAKDNDTVFIGCGLTLEGADADSFKILDSGFASDKNYAYHFSKRIDGADTTSFQALRGGYAKDTMAAYYQEEKLNADIASFETLDGYYAKDKQKVYFAGIPIEGADTVTFEVVSGKQGRSDFFAGKDKNHIYEYGRVVEGKDPRGCMPETIEIGGCDSSKG